MVCFEVEGNPVSKERPRTVSNYDRNGRRQVRTYTPEKTKSQEEKIAWAYRLKYGSKKFEEGIPLRLVCRFYFKAPNVVDGKYVTKDVKRRMLSGEIRPMNHKDVDNLIKTVADSGNKIIYADDSQIVEMIGEKYYSENPRTEILIEEI